MDSARYKNKLKFLVLIILLGLLWYSGRFLRIDTQNIEKTLYKFPVLYSSILYIIVYVIVTFFTFFSKDIFWIVGAVVFGAYLSTLLVIIAELVNVFILFHLARYLGRNFVEHYLKEKRKTESIDERLANINFFWLFMVRLVPLIPYRFLDLGIGLTKIPFKKYLTVALLASPIRIFWMQYTLAFVGKSIINRPEVLAGQLLQNKPLFIFTFIYSLLVILVAFKLKHKL